MPSYRPAFSGLDQRRAREATRYCEVRGPTPLPACPGGRGRHAVWPASIPGTAAQLCALEHDGSFQLLVATILSAQCTDERVNMVTPGLFAAYPTPQSLAAAPVEDLEERIRSTGFFRSKAKNLLGMALGVTERFGGEVPSSMEDLTSLPGVGRKTANVVRSVAMGLPGLPVDTHVGRLTRRLGLTTADRPREGRERDRRARSRPRSGGLSACG